MTDEGTEGLLEARLSGAFGGVEATGFGVAAGRLLLLRPLWTAQMARSSKVLERLERTAAPAVPRPTPTEAVR